MENSFFTMIESLIGKQYASVAQQSRHSRRSLISNLLHQRRLPDEGWDDLSIQLLLTELSGMDMNNTTGTVGVGEREGRVYSNLVKSRHYGMTHGIGRSKGSGNLMDLQPKAPGSSLMNRLTQYLMRDTLRYLGLKAVEDCVILPVATGMALHLCISQLRQTRPIARFVIWSRIDQKSCIKSVLSTGFELVVIQLKQQSDALITDVEEIERKVLELGPANVLCIFTTTSTFAPRIPDDIPGVAKICQRYDVPHLVNNAYGLQCSKCIHLVEVGCHTGRVDYIVQSTDKNFMVPVGGSIVASPNSKNISLISSSYPGRASSTPTMDLFITLLQMGRHGLSSLCCNRKELFQYLKLRLDALSEKYSISILNTPANGISIAINISKLQRPELLGPELYIHRCSGPRVVVVNNPVVSKIENVEFRNFGSHSNCYPYDYMTVACALGMTKKEIDIFMERLEATLLKQKTIRSSINDQNCTQKH